MRRTGRRHDIAPYGGARSPGRTLAGVAAVLAVTAGVLYGGFVLLAAGPDDPEVVAARGRFERFLDAWESGDARRAGRLTDRPADAESLIRSVMTNLGPSRTEITPGAGERTDRGAVAIPFTVRMTLPGAGRHAWDSTADLLRRGGTWKVEFRTPVIHPEMAPGQTLALKRRARAPILARDGRRLRSASLVGTVDPATGRGTSGLQARYDEQLVGSGGVPNRMVVVERASGRVVRALTTPRGPGGTPVRTTVDQRVQQAAADALRDVDGDAALVAIQPSSGHILAAANVPAGMNRALVGHYPPGSTFKVVTAAALLERGMRVSDRAACPRFAYANGQRFENQDRFVLPRGATLRDAFAKSCNTFFVRSRKKFSDSALHDTAGAFGVGGTWDVGAATFDGSVPVADGDNDKAASTIGQGRVQVSPLVMASIAATVKQGEFAQPVLVPGKVRHRHRATRRLAPEVVDGLRDMMRATVTYGAAAALRDVPGEPHAKTGTAEFGDGTPPRTHAWMIGYQGRQDLAWAVLLADGGSGSADAGPVAVRFLRNLDR
ncbi:penicillin-binding transpeptidase domain-containing protein [Streptomyces sp. TR06-5]|uniref:penicillin-binding transpeptidase domain-containing protein n=1 Tax=Streptomyces sp. TR06-5 TaxID=3385976 RepID=UPI0039A18D9F